MKEIESLKQLLDHYDNLYYNEDNPEITDLEYDKLKEKYLSLTNQSEYDYIPGKAQFSKYTHKIPVKSLAKVNTEGDLRKELIRLEPAVIEFKYDGLTLVYYKDGAIVTRGNGEIGEDVQDTARKVLNLPKLHWEEDEYELKNLPVRLEAFITKRVFEKLNTQRKEQGLEPFSNARNAVAGILRNKELKNVKGITYRAYNILGDNRPQEEQLEILKELGFKTDDSFYYEGEDGIEEAMHYILNFDRSKLDYEIDGLVIKSNKRDSLKIFGETGHHPKNAIAYKFPNQGVWTRLIDITWQVGRTGVITPVAELEPVGLMGSVISRATLHNITYIESLKLRIGDDVMLVKANDIIPAIVDCRGREEVKPINIPVTCPNCGVKLREENRRLFCDNMNCTSKLLYRTKHMVGRDALNIEGLNEQTIQKFIDIGYIKKPWDIFDITEQQLLKLDGFAKKSALKLYQSIQNARTVELNRFIYATGISLIGRTASKDIAKCFKSWENIYNIWKTDDKKIEYTMFAIDGIGIESVNSFMSNFNLLIELSEKMNKIIGLEVKKADNNSAITDLIFVITGSVNTYKNRDELKNIIESLGGKVAGSVSKNTNYLINNDNTSTTGKNKKAQELGVKIITEEEFNNMIGE